MINFNKVLTKKNKDIFQILPKNEFIYIVYGCPKSSFNSLSVTITRKISPSISFSRLLLINTYSRLTPSYIGSMERSTLDILIIKKNNIIEYLNKCIFNKTAAINLNKIKSYIKRFFKW
jgi:hypothetical protein